MGGWDPVGTKLGDWCLSCCSLEGGGLKDVNPGLSLPQFLWVETGLVKMVVVRPPSEHQ